MSAEDRGDTSELIARFIQKRNRVGQLVSKEDILRELKDRNRSAPETEDSQAAVDITLQKMIEEDQDLKELRDHPGASRYYSSRFMSDPYARIVLRKEKDPLLLISETVREHSSTLPRPIPLESFKESPFELTQEEILNCLMRMAEHEEYQDIAQTITSAGTVFLYSTLHLDHTFASNLAEWLDVGQFESP